MINNLNKILLIISTALTVLILVSAVLGSINRIGYLSEFKINVNNTLEINGLDVKETKELFTVDNKLNETDITNYIFTNNSITNYSYYFRIKYYSKVFRNSDLYGVYFEVPKSVVINNTSIELKNIKNYETGSPFGNFISTKELKYGDKIDNINYKLKLKIPVWIVFTICLIYLLLYSLRSKLHICFRNKELILKILKISSISIIVIYLLLFILGMLNHRAHLENLQLIAETKAGYVYKIKMANSGLFSENFIYKYGNEVKLKNKPYYIKYGYNLLLDTPLGRSHPDFKAFIDRNYEGFIVSNSNDSQGVYGYNIELSKGEKYIVTLEAKKLSENVGGVIKYHLNSSASIPIPNTDKMADNYQKYISELEIKKDIVSTKPAIRILFPSGVINVKSIKIEQVSDNLYLKSDNNIIFTSTKKIDDINEIGDINYKLYINNYMSITAIVILLFLFYLLFYIKKIIYYINKLNDILIQKSRLIKNIAVVIILSFILIIILATFLGKQERIGYLSDFTLVSSKDGEYNYSFRIKYYSKIFKNNYIYEVYPDLYNLPDYIKSAKMNDRFGVTPLGSLTSTKELKYDDKIDTKYKLRISFNLFYYMTIFILIILLCTGYYFLKEYWKYKRTLDNEDYLFIKKIELVGILLFCFQYWLFWPGYYDAFDTWRSARYALYNTSSNWDPILIELSIRFIDKIGLTMSSFFFINLFLWYFSISLIIISLYLKFKNKMIILLFSISFIIQIFLSNIEYLKDHIATLYFIFSYSIVFFMILCPLKNKNKNILKIISLLSLIISMLHRHNFIVTVYPILIWFTYDYLKSKNISNIKKYLLYFAGIMFINAMILIGIYYIFPRIFLNYINKTSSYHIYYLQIAGCLVPANDPSLIPEHWWGKNKSFKDLVKQYNDNPFYADHIRNNGIFVSSKDHLSEVKKVWIKSILKYPINYIKHMFNYAKTFYTYKYDITLGEVEGVPRILEILEVPYIKKGYYDFKDTEFYKENQGIKFTKLKRSIYDLLVDHILIRVNIFLFILISIILFLISGILLTLKKEYRNNILVFTFSVSFSAVTTAIIVAAFSPAIAWHSYRYIYPVIPISIIALIGFITFIYDIGGLKKFIKELRGNNK